MSIVKILLAVLVYSLSVSASLGQTPATPYTVEVWSSVLFGPDGRVAEYKLIDEAKYPVKFVENVKARVSRAKIESPQEDGKAVTLRTGVRIDFVVTPTAEGGTVRTAGLSMGPIPLNKYLASYPKDIAQTGGWQGQVEGTCRIGTDGRCTSIEVSSLPGMPESVRRYMKASLEGWIFEPQQVNAKPIEGEYKLILSLDTLDGAPEDFRQDKFQRIINGR
jgi:hypothetical protein